LGEGDEEMKGIVVLEGADSSGKTTLAKAIIGKDAAAVYMHGLPWVGWVEEAHAAMLKAAAKHVADGRLVVIDRHWVSEYVYGPIFRGRIAYGDWVTQEFDRLIRGSGLYVLCVPSDAAKHEARFQRERPEKKDLFDTMTKVADVYRRLAAGDMLHEGQNYLDRYIRHGDFTLSGCLTYDLDRHGADVPAFVAKIKESLEP
jgi:thymidylate kinase